MLTRSLRFRRTPHSAKAGVLLCGVSVVAGAPHAYVAHTRMWPTRLQGEEGDIALLVVEPER